MILFLNIDRVIHEIMKLHNNYYLDRNLIMY